MNETETVTMAANSRMQNHFSVSIDYAEALIKESDRFLEVFKMNGKVPTKKEVLDYFDQLRLRGYSVLPPCDNIRSDGACKGHPY